MLIFIASVPYPMLLIRCFCLGNCSVLQFFLLGPFRPRARQIKFMLHEANFHAAKHHCEARPMSHCCVCHTSIKIVARQVVDIVAKNELKSCFTFRSDFGYKFHVTGVTAQCNTVSFATCQAIILRDKLRKILPRIKALFNCAIFSAKLLIFLAEVS